MSRMPAASEVPVSAAVDELQIVAEDPSVDEQAECDRAHYSQKMTQNQFYSEHAELGSETESRLSDSRRSLSRRDKEKDDANQADHERVNELSVLQKHVVPEQRLEPKPEQKSDFPVGISGSSPVHIITEDQNFSAAKFRWIQAVNKIRIKLRENAEGAAPVEKMRKSNWGAQAIASNFLSSIDSMPNFKPRRKSIPLVSEISAALLNRQKGGISSVLIGSRVSVQDMDNNLIMIKFIKWIPRVSVTPWKFIQ